MGSCRPPAAQGKGYILGQTARLLLLPEPVGRFTFRARAGRGLERTAAALARSLRRREPAGAGNSTCCRGVLGRQGGRPCRVAAAGECKPHRARWRDHRLTAPQERFVTHRLSFVTSARPGSQSWERPPAPVTALTPPAPSWPWTSGICPRCRRYLMCASCIRRSFARSNSEPRGCLRKLDPWIFHEKPTSVKETGSLTILGLVEGRFIDYRADGLAHQNGEARSEERASRCTTVFFEL